MKFVAKYIALATLVLVTIGQSYAEPLRSTSIPSSLADDEKRLMPKVMNEFYGSFGKEKHPFSFYKEEKGCWISTKSGPYPQAGPYMWGVDKENTVNVDTTYCMKPIRLDVIKSNGRKMLFVVAGGNFLVKTVCLRGRSRCRAVRSHRTDAERRKLRRSWDERSL